MQIQLPEKFTNQLIALPENGMGYQLVKVILKNGEILRKHKVLNASFLILNDGKAVNKTDIAEIELEK